ncbi:MAG TPA: molybdopterin-dependent oxidoreductase, partial [Nitrospira sp.]
QTKDNELIEVNSAQGAGRNNGDLCARGFFGFHAAAHPERLTKPLIRRNGVLVEATWEEALELTAGQLARIKNQHGPDAIGGLISSRLTNEELYLFQKFMRLAIGTNNLDSSARYGQLNAVQATRRVQGTYRWTVSYEDLTQADTLLLIGTNITEANPVTGLRIKEAVKKHHATLLTIEALQPAVDTISNIANLSEQHLCVQPDQFGSVVLGLLKAMTEGGLDESVKTRASNYVATLSNALEGLSWQDLTATAGVSREDCIAMAERLRKGRRVIVVAGQELLRSAGGYRTCVNLLDLLLLLGKLTLPGCGFAALAEENNDQGAVEMGAAAELLPGGCDLADQDARSKLNHLWRSDIPAAAGATLTDMIGRARAGQIKSMLIVGENPVATLPPHLEVKEALQKLEFVVCQELFLTETASLAHVVLPAASSLEKAGTFTNSEGHVQAVRPVIAPIGDSRPDWEIFSALGVLLGASLDYADAKELLKEIRNVIPGYGLLGPAPVVS